MSMRLGEWFDPAWGPRYKWAKTKQGLLMWIAWRLPKPLVMWAAYRVGANATTGKYGNQLVSKLTFMEAMDRWA